MRSERTRFTHAEHDLPPPSSAGKEPHENESSHQASRVGWEWSKRSLDCAGQPAYGGIGDSSSGVRGGSCPVDRLPHAVGPQPPGCGDIGDQNLDGQPSPRRPTKRLAGGKRNGREQAVRGHRLYSGPKVEKKFELSRDAVEWRRIEGEVIAIDLGRSVYLAVNGSGALLWELLAQGTTRATLVDRLVQTFGIEEHRAEEDVDRFLTELERRRLLATSQA
jgi:Coenzyme PQQ synthesis protein D (PqqD)